MKTILQYMICSLCLMVWTASPLWAQKAKDSERSAEAAAVQILLDRARFSPGSIDGLWGEGDSRTRVALKAFQQTHGLTPNGQADEPTMKALEQAAGVQDPYTQYTISSQDTQGPFAESVPSDWKQMSERQSLPYTSPAELLGEKFHCSPEFLKQLNPGASFRQGESIRVPAVDPFKLPTKGEKLKGGEEKAEEVVVSGPDQTLTVKGKDGSVLFFAPITPGSQELPLPSGTFEVKGIDVMPTYYFSPKVIKEAKIQEKLKIPSGPNNPVGVVWIALSKEHYGIHGTPDPEKIGYQTSHGCVRLTNWDAVEVARLVSKGTPVQFITK